MASDRSDADTQAVSKSLMRGKDLTRSVFKARIFVLVMCGLVLVVDLMLPTAGVLIRSTAGLSIFLLGLGVVSLITITLLIRAYDIRLTELHVFDQALTQSEAMFRSLAEIVPVGIFKADHQGNCVFVNPRYSEISGREFSDSLGQGWLSAVHPDDLNIVSKKWQALLENGTAFSAEYRLIKPDTTIVWVYLQAQREVSPVGELHGHVCATTDITPSKLAEQEIQLLAFYDPLTCLPNRRLLMDRLQQSVAGISRSDHGGALFFLDLDNFKSLNDTAGHEKGDLLLQQVARRLTGSIREGDTVARVGGDEFVLVLENLSTDASDAARQAESVAQKILDSLNGPYQLDGLEYHSTPSIGVTLFDKGKEDVAELMKRADMAMYQAKAAGGNTMRFFDPDTQAVVAARIVLEKELRKGLRANQFLLYYQPQVDDIGRVTGAEAFVRWQHPDRGMVSPSTFIPLAEETGLIVELGNWVLTAACLQLAKWGSSSETNHLFMAVKVSALQFRMPDFVSQVIGVLYVTQARPEMLKLELNESLLIANVEDIIAKTNALNQHGVEFSLADLGTGYSSLSHLKRLSLDQLRIDQSFVRGLLTNSNDAAVTKSIFALAESLDLTVSAEGVETLEQRDALAAYGCHAYQGYLFSQPLGADEFARLLEKQ
jgi:diguanylate cyclase (GGDEF)-like protein/PAS domain S-box-containing protein